ncbi:hypothetical protein CHH28_02095 [Bacterioplanes sanyensis]|uniref:Uncharacterized protein n=1 Tax=Bacterioplanes sanyensis TaxID=1249553 RepID=A0A222FEL7_9GAMM|nr:hypothetical protein [Bacterioplanes sanyensis]ASP37537.1 hypothetical protein CHH28_02095 [Bacterioplanes sanyensis]
MKWLLITLAVALAGCASQPAAQDKIQPEVQRMAQQNGESRQPVLLRLTQAASESQLQQLRDLGVVLGAVTGPIVSASIPTVQLSSVAALPFVERIEASRQRPKKH